MIISNIHVPKELVITIFSFIPHQCLFSRLLYVNKKFNIIITKSSSGLYYELCKREYNPKNYKKSKNEMCKMYGNNWMEMYFNSFFYKWSSVYKNKEIKLSKNGFLCEMMIDERNISIAIDKIFEKGKHEWIVQHSGKPGCCIGIVRSENLKEVSKHNGECYKGWIGSGEIAGSYGIHLSSGMCYYEGKRIKRINDIISHQTKHTITLKFTLDLEKNNMSLSRFDNSSLNPEVNYVVFSGLKGSFSPALSFYYKGEKARILNIKLFKKQTNKLEEIS